MLVILAVDAASEIIIIGLTASMRRPRTKLRVLLIVLMVADLLFYVGTMGHFPRLAPYLRVAFLTLNEAAVLLQFRMILRIVPDFARIVSLMVVLVLVFTWFGVVSSEPVVPCAPTPHPPPLQ